MEFLKYPLTWKRAYRKLSTRNYIIAGNSRKRFMTELKYIEKCFLGYWFIMVHIVISQDYCNRNHQTIEEVAWLPFQKLIVISPNCEYLSIVGIQIAYTQNPETFKICPITWLVFIIKVMWLVGPLQTGLHWTFQTPFWGILCWLFKPLCSTPKQQTTKNIRPSFTILIMD